MADETNAATPPTGTDASSSKPAETVSEIKAADTIMDEGQAEENVEDIKTNGEAEHATGETSDQVAPAEEEDTEMKDDEDTAVSGSGQPAAAVQGTPSSSKKAANGSAKKKSAGVPEHKSKKLNKKKSKPQITQLDAEPGEYYLARMKGHPAWPSVICDEEMLPQSLLDTRPVTTKQPNGTFKKPEYAEGGKRAYERTFPIMFLHTNEFAWIANTDLTPLDPTTCSDVEAKGKTKQLLAAYATAAENQSLGHYKKVLQDHQEAVQAEAEAQAERETKKASKGKRKSDAARSDAAARLSEDVGDMSINEEEVAPKPKSKKRKKEPDSDEDEEKPAKTPKTNTKLKLTTPKTPASEPTKKKKAAKPKSTGKKSAAKAASDDDEVVDTPKAEEKPLTAAENKEKKEKMVLYYRHKLQRGFLSRDTTPKEEEMKVMSDFLKELEGYPDLEGSIIRTTKIHKVLKAMIKLPAIPLDEEFKFKDRAHALLQKWNEILASDPGATGADKEAETTTKAATTNGESMDVEKQAEEAEAGEAAAPEEENEEELENKIGTTTEGEKEAEKPDVTEAKEPEKSDAPDVDNAPAEEYKPPADETEDEPAA